MDDKQNYALFEYASYKAKIYGRLIGTINALEDLYVFLSGSVLDDPTFLTQKELEPYISFLTNFHLNLKKEIENLAPNFTSEQLASINKSWILERYKIIDRELKNIIADQSRVVNQIAGEKSIGYANYRELNKNIDKIRKAEKIFNSLIQG